MSLPPLSSSTNRSNTSTNYSIDLSAFPVLSSKKVTISPYSSSLLSSTPSSVFSSTPFSIPSSVHSNIPFKERVKQTKILRQLQQTKQKKSNLNKKILALNFYRQFGIKLKEKDIRDLSEEELIRKIEEFKKRNKAASTIQHEWKDYLRRKEIKILNRSAILIQRKWKEAKQRKEKRETELKKQKRDDEIRREKREAEMRKENYHATGQIKNYEARESNNKKTAQILEDTRNQLKEKLNDLQDMMSKLKQQSAKVILRGWKNYKLRKIL